MTDELGVCLVTGATGFVGRQLLAALTAQGSSVRALVRRMAELGDGVDVRVAALTAQEGLTDLSVLDNVKTVFHLAGVAHTKAAESVHRESAAASILLAKQAAAMGVERFIYVSTTKAMAEPGHSCIDENSSGEPQEPYGIWKKAVEQFLLTTSTLPFVSILRPCLIYGPSVRGNLYSLLRAIDNGVFPPLPETRATRSMVSVQDVVRAMVFMARQKEANRQVFIASDGAPYTAHGIYLALRLALGKGTPRWYVPRFLLQVLGQCGDLVALVWHKCPLNSSAVDRLTCPAQYSANKLRALGWVPITTFHEQVPAMVEAYRQTR